MIYSHMQIELDTVIAYIGSRNNDNFNSISFMCIDLKFILVKVKSDQFNGTWSNTMNARQQLEAIRANLRKEIPLTRDAKGYIKFDSPMVCETLTDNRIIQNALEQYMDKERSLAETLAFLH